MSDEKETQPSTPKISPQKAKAIKADMQAAEKDLFEFQKDVAALARVKGISMVMVFGKMLTEINTVHMARLKDFTDEGIPRTEALKYAATLAELSSETIGECIGISHFESIPVDENGVANTKDLEIDSDGRFVRPQQPAASN